MSSSLKEQIQQLPLEKREAWVESLPEDVVHEIKRRPWWFIGRPEQQEPDGDWVVWLILSGRGWGKTRTGAEWLAKNVLENPVAPDGSPTQWAIIGSTFGDSKNICVEGPSGFLKALEHKGLISGQDYVYNKSSYKIVFKDGQRVHMFGADTPDAGRGLNLSGGWLDELAMWGYSYETWTEGIAPSLRIGKRPRVVVTTTPKPIKLLREWKKRTDGSVYVTLGSTFDNANNLSQAALVELKARYEGTRIGRQELYGELLEDFEGALWNRTNIDQHRVTIDEVPALVRIVVGVDPAVTNNEDSDSTGIVTAGYAANGHYYIIADDTMRGTPQEWATKVAYAYDKHSADRIISETNNGGDLVIHLLNSVRPNIPVKKVTATRGKAVRAEPISALYEQGRVHHIGSFPQLEEQMCEWVPGISKDSPDRMDAMVWALTELLEGTGTLSSLASLGRLCPTCSFPNIKSAGVCTNCGQIL